MTALAVVQAFGVEADTFMGLAGVSKSVTNAFDAGLSTFEKAVDTDDPTIAIASALVAAVVVASIAPEVLAASTSLILGEEALMGAAAFVDESIIALRAPALFSLTSGSAITASASSAFGGLVVGEGIGEIALKAFAGLATFYTTTNDLSIANVDGPVNVASGTQVVIAQSDTVTVGSGAQVALLGNNNLIAPDGNNSIFFNGGSGDSISLSSLNGTLNVSDDPGTSSTQAATGETITESSSGAVTITDAFGNQLASFTAAQAAGDTIQINGSEIDVYNSSNQLLNSTRVQSNGDVVDTVYNQSGGALASTTNIYDTSGQPISITKNFSSGYAYTFGAKDYANLNYNSSTNILSANLTTPGGEDVGTLSINVLNDTGSFALPPTIPAGDTGYVADDIQIALNSIPNQPSMIDPPATPEQILLGYLSDLGVSLTAAQLDQDNYASIHPAVTTTYTLPTSDFHITSISGLTANVLIQADLFLPAGADIIGPKTIGDGGVTYQVASNTLSLNGLVLVTPVDLSQDTITNIQTLASSDGVCYLTATQFNSFNLITGLNVSEESNESFGTLVAATGGTYDLNDSNIDPNSGFNLVASDWSGTTLIGSNNGATESLQASLFGNDTLIAGNGAGDVLIAGEGVDTLIGGAGGDRFYAYAGLAAGSVIEGNGSGNLLEAGGDLTGVTITGVQTLVAYGAVTLTIAELNGFSTIDGTLSVSDSSANVLANLTTLESFAATGQLTAIALTDSGIPTLTLTETQYIADSAALALITSPYNVSVTVGSNVSEYDLFQNVNSGQVYEWQLNGTSVVASSFVGNNTDPSWQVVGTGDFTGTGNADILFQNSSSGQVYEWLMNGFSVTGGGVAGNNTDPSWQVVGTGDFTGNGIDDVLFQNASSGQVYEWEMNSTSVIGSGVVGNNTDPSWRVVGTGDFTGNGIDDVLFQNASSGQVYEWEMNGTSVVGSGVVGNNTDPTWQVVGTGDFTGNGIDDVLFQNASSGQVYEWEMNGTSVVGSGVVGNNTDPAWQVVGIGDFTGNGKSDILFQNVNSGQVYEWEMNGTSVVGSGVVGNNTDPSWHAAVAKS